MKTNKPDTKFTFVEVITCEHVTTVSPGSTTSQMGCVYEMSKDNLKENKPVKFNDDAQSTFNSNGTIIISFNKLKTLNQINVQTKEGKTLNARIKDVNGKSEIVTLKSSITEVVANPMHDLHNVKEIEIFIPNDKIKTDDLKRLEILACDEGKQ